MKNKPSFWTKARVGRSRRLSRAFSLVELMVCISLIGVFSGLAVTQFGQVTPAARQTAGTDTMNLLNRAVLHYGQINANIAVSPVEGSTDDELAVLALLKVRDAAVPGSPYVSADFSTDVSDEINTVRARWNGKFFQLIPEGVAGTGLEIAR